MRLDHATSFAKSVARQAGKRLLVAVTSAFLCLLVLTLAFLSTTGTTDDCANECDSADCACLCHLPTPFHASCAMPNIDKANELVFPLHRAPPDLLLVADIFRPPTA